MADVVSLVCTVAIPLLLLMHRVDDSLFGILGNWFWIVVSLLLVVLFE